MRTNDMFWFYLEPYVYATVKKDKVLLYNTLDHNSIIKEDTLIAKTIRSILDLANCGVISIKYNPNHTDSFTLFIQEVRNKFMGDIIPVEMSTCKPVQLLPLVHLKQEVKKKKMTNSNTVQGIDLLQYLSEISLNINRTCQFNCKHCLDYGKQFNFCSNSALSDDKNDLTYIERMIDYITRYNYNGRINLFGGDFLWLKQNVHKVESIISPIKNLCKVYCHQNALDTVLSSGLFEKGQLILLLDYPLKKNIYDFIIKENIKEIHAVIQSDSEFIHFESVFEDIQDSLQIKYLPFYNRKNKNFFKQHIFLGKEDILSGVKNMQYIHRNITLNMFFWGKLQITSNGDIYSNKNKKPLGNIQNSDLLDIIYKELTSEDSSWIQIRNMGKCKKCLFQYLCPPISNYEYCFNKYNICNLSDSE